MTRTTRLFPLVAAAALAAAFAIPATASAGGRPITTTLTGAAETSPGDPDGSGSATLRINPGQGEICYSLEVADLDPVFGAHIHEAPAGSAGPVVVALAPPVTGSSSGCADVGRELALEILKNPADYYVNVHSTAYPAGAVRGQLG